MSREEEIRQGLYDGTLYGRAPQVKALTEVAEHALVFLSHEEAVDVAEWIARNWDLAPKGSLYAFKQAIAKLAKGPAYTE